MFWRWPLSWALQWPLWRAFSFALTFGSHSSIADLFFWLRPRRRRSWFVIVMRVCLCYMKYVKLGLQAPCFTEWTDQNSMFVRAFRTVYVVWTTIYYCVYDHGLACHWIWSYLCVCHVSSGSGVCNLSHPNFWLAQLLVVDSRGAPGVWCTVEKIWIWLRNSIDV